MKKFLKFFLYGGAALILAVIIFIIYFNSSYPKVEAPKNITVEATPERLARGEYLANHITVCMDCHSERDWTKFAGPIVPGSFGKGGEMFNEELGGVPGTLYAKNITPAGIGKWTDGELMRLITNGVNKDGNAIFPLMPYLSYNNLTQEDLYSIVAYVRSLQPIENAVGESSLNFPLNFIVKTIPPEKYIPAEEVDKTNKQKYGEYLVNIAGCADCHTPQDKGEPLPGMYCAGGFEFKMPGGTVRSMNITPDEETGIGVWTVDDFVARFKNFDPDSSEYIPVAKGEFNTPMPWTMYAGMKTEDLEAIYTYLKSVKPVSNRVERFTEEGAEFRN